MFCRRRRKSIEIWWKILKVRDCFANVEIDGKTVFLKILKKEDRRLGTGFIRPRICKLAD
jgi:hypothetical protein